MNRKILLSLLILGSGSILATVYAPNTLITNTSVSTTTVNTSDLVASHDVNTTNLFISGTCSGCGGGSGSFTSYNTVALNGTAPGSDGFGTCGVDVGNDGATILGGALRTQLVYLNGTTVYNHPATGCNLIPDISQSTDGKYKVLEDGTTFVISVYKSGGFLQNLGFRSAQCYLGNGGPSLGISPDGHYISLGCQDSSRTSDRVVVFQGS